ncbi:MAG: flagellar biosynthesis protein FlhB [Desulfobacterales bacterium]|nr:flagellar biosynthesis protein FlhB [Desulfobacterales bacterium]MCP4161718.1 flagellar biosynthesis protein FlhB [Deltaproteobacteria bacterium]
MAEDNMQEKTETATAKRRLDARKEGDVAKSQEIPSVFVLLSGVIVINYFGFYMYENISRILIGSFSFDSIPVFTSSHCLGLLYQFTSKFLIVLAPVLAGIFLAAVFTNYMMVGYFVSWKVIGLNFTKLDPINGFKRMFALKSFMEMVKSILKLIVIGGLTYLAVRDEMVHIMRLYDHNVAMIFLFLLKLTFKIFLWVVLSMAIVAILDYAFQKWQHEEKIKMTKQEVKEELKQSEGDPKIKSRIRQLQYEASQKRMMAEVPKADVIITNPTHLALALKYDPETGRAPFVTAKGAGTVAARIKEIAREAGVPVVENKSLARNLYKIVEIGDEIPADLYKAVAELLAYVYKLKGKKM